MRVRPVPPLVTVVVAVTVMLSAAGCASKPSAAGGDNAALDGATLVQQRCTRCHSSDRIDAAKHDKAGWQATVDRMRGKGAQVNDSEASIVIEYLSTR